MQWRTVTVFGAIVLLLLLPLAASAAGGVNARTLSAYANFASSDPLEPNCIINYAGITAVEGRNHAGPGQPESTVWVDVFLSRYSYCNDYVQLVDATGRVDAGKAALQISGNLENARLRATLPVYDTVSGATFPVAIDISFAPAGDVVVAPDGKQRDAVATGQVVAQGVDYATDPTITAYVAIAQTP